MGIQTVSGVTPVESLDSLDKTEKKVNSVKNNLPKKERVSFSQMLYNLKQQSISDTIASSSANANMPAKVETLSSKLNGDYISSFEISNPNPADKIAMPKGDAAKSLLANGKTIDKTSQLYEKSMELESYFVKIMLNTMRKTLSGTAFGDEGYASKMYKDMMYDEMSRTVTKNAGFGLADQIYLQLKQS